MPSTSASHVVRSTDLETPITTVRVVEGVPKVDGYYAVAFSDSTNDVASWTFTVAYELVDTPKTPGVDTVVQFELRAAVIEIDSGATAVVSASLAEESYNTATGANETGTLSVNVALHGEASLIEVTHLARTGVLDPGNPTRWNEEMERSYFVLDRNPEGGREGVECRNGGSPATGNVATPSWGYALTTMLVTVNSPACTPAAGGPSGSPGGGGGDPDCQPSGLPLVCAWVDGSISHWINPATNDVECTGASCFYVPHGDGGHVGLLHVVGNLDVGGTGRDHCVAGAPSGIVWAGCPTQADGAMFVGVQEEVCSYALATSHLGPFAPKRVEPLTCPASPHGGHPGSSLPMVVALELL